MAKDSTPPDLSNFVIAPAEMPLFVKMQVFLTGDEERRPQFSETDNALIAAHKERWQDAEGEAMKWSYAEGARVCAQAKQRDRAALAAGDIVEVAREYTQVRLGYEERLRQFHQSLIDSLSEDGQNVMAGFLARDLSKRVGKTDMDFVRIAEAYPEFATERLVDNCDPNPNVQVVRKTTTNEDGSIARESVQYVPGGNE